MCVSWDLMLYYSRKCLNKLTLDKIQLANELHNQTSNICSSYWLAKSQDNDNPRNRCAVLCCVYTKFWSFNWFNVICVLSIAQNPVPNIQSAALMEITFRKIDPTFVCYAIFGSNKTERVRPLNFKLRRVMISNG